MINKKEKYSNFSEGYAKGIATMYGGIALGIFSLYKLGQGEKRYIQLFAGFVVGVYGVPTLMQKGLRRIKMKK